MSDALKVYVNFVAVSAGGTQTLPHHLNVAGKPVAPDKVDLQFPLTFAFVSSDALNITVRNISDGVGNCRALLQAWHPVERSFGLGLPDDGTFKQHLTPQPFVEGFGSGSGSSNLFQNFVFRPGGPADRNVYNDFALLEADIKLYEGYATIQIDNTFVAPPTPVVIPAKGAGADWDFGSNHVELTAHPNGLEVGNVPIRVNLADGCTFANLVQIGGYMLLQNLNTLKAPIIVPANTGMLFTLGSGPQNNYPQIANNGTQPFFDMTAAGSFMLIRIQGTITGSHPAIAMGANAGPLQFSLYDSSRVTADMITGSNAAAVVRRFEFGNSHTFGQQPNFAGSIGNGQPQTNFQQGSSPVSRDWLVPAAIGAAEIVPLTAPIPIGPGAINIYNTTAGDIAQPLPKIRNPAPVTGGQGQTDGTNYTGGQTLMIKNLTGANNVNVSPAAGDNIDGGGGPIVVAPGQCFSFKSTGVATWLIVATKL